MNAVRLPTETRRTANMQFLQSSSGQANGRRAIQATASHSGP
jgi:hypothetical protein